MKTEKWEFVRDSRGLWHWRYTQPSGSQRTSSQTFLTEAAAIEDAIKHGFVPTEVQPG